MADGPADVNEGPGVVAEPDGGLDIVSSTFGPNSVRTALALPAAADGVGSKGEQRATNRGALSKLTDFSRRASQSRRREIISGLRGWWPSHRQEETKGAADFYLALDPNPAAVRLYQRFGYREPHTGLP